VLERREEFKPAGEGHRRTIRTAQLPGGRIVAFELELELKAHASSVAG
jgi:hypothetical protein